MSAATVRTRRFGPSSTAAVPEAGSLRRSPSPELRRTWRLSARSAVWSRGGAAAGVGSNVTQPICGKYASTQECAS